MACFKVCACHGSLSNLVYFTLFIVELNPYLYLGITDSLNQEPHSQPVLPVPAVPGTLDDNDDNDGGEVSGPLVESHIDLVKMACKWLLIVLLPFTFLLMFPEH